ncbi:hypothetical protein PNIG_a2173 [Pseudoalteromonas nigrifaciens]|uniref:DUF3466 family protein n=1 Tax=Pseudoalteromonas nigrifaciens TaxID=28109 RepID=A0AAC9UID1_9GAMM|nr:DUF3466 family protein [Pseudoalteromonas nigrifaciens]ASM54223.1 hypothetical protein PNIG_a2173 [Pseudoalteromonas nigrifaciens]GEN41306.1 hypothetical protein PNI02_07720 [Pseudoalteromonas nigrifaciens]SUC51947.1 Protein of uncharacterised function (DUF3466) [Pseudoalteromonas nigrifaciens]
MKYKLLAASILATMSTSALSATYQLTELGALEGAKLSYVTDVSESGHVIGIANGLYNLPVDIEHIDFTESSIKSAYTSEVNIFERSNKEITFTLEDIEKNNAVATNADAHSFMVRFLANMSSSYQFQKLSSLTAIKYDSGAAVEQTLFDISSPDYPGVTRSVTNFYNAVAEDGTTVGWGSAPYNKKDFTPENENEAESWFTRDFIERGIIISESGVEVPLEPQFSEYGGTSQASDIVKTADGYIVVGNMSLGIPQSRQTNITDNCDEKDEPFLACIEVINNQTTRGLFNKQATKWTLDNAFNITFTEVLGLALAPDDDETENTTLISNALAVNSKGVAVGVSNTRYFDRESTILTMPAYFKDGEVIDFIEQRDDWQGGMSLAINDNNIITGYATKRLEGTLRNKFFYHDIATGTTVYPDSYFTSSSSYGNSINNQGYIVGEGEVGVSDSSRRSAAFIYKIGDDKITNLNDLLPCYDMDGTSSYGYSMSEAKVINENNEIFGVATKTVEKRNSLGEVVTDVNGKTEYESVAVAVKLSPIPNGTIEDCAPPDAEVYERRSASFSWYGLLLLPLIAFRRVFRF